MPRMKTHSASKKRFKKTGKGRVKRAKAFRRHLLTKKTRKNKRSLRKTSYIESCDIASIKTLLPYS